MDPETAGDCEPCSPSRLSAFGFRIGLSLVFAGQGMVFSLGYNNARLSGEAPPFGSSLYWILHGGIILSSLIVVGLLGGPLLRESARALKERRLSVEALFVLSAMGAFVGSLVSTLEGSGSIYYEVVSIVLCVYAIGRQIASFQRGRVAEALSRFRHAFDFAVVEGPEGQRSTKPVNDLTLDDRVLVGPGEPIPVDGEIIEGSGYIRETALTGEPGPVVRGSGDRVLGGTWSIDGNLRVKPVHGKSRFLDAILLTLENAPARPSRLQLQADRLMQFFVPFVSLVAIATFLGWLLLSGEPWWHALFNSMAVLLVACPCALGLAMPAGVWSGLYHLGQNGLVGRNGQLLDSLADCTSLVFDKTGTVTEFDPDVDGSWLRPADGDSRGLLEDVAVLSRDSNHPISSALAARASQSVQLHSLKIFPGRGLSGQVNGRTLLLGEPGLLREHGVEVSSDEAFPPGKQVHVGCNGHYAGAIILKETVKAEAGEVIESLREMGYGCHILSGDPAPERESICGLKVRWGLSPDEKARFVNDLRSSGEKVLFVGDGINDLPAMESSDAALAIDMGAALTAEFADGILLKGRLNPLPSALFSAKRIKRTLNGNLLFALTYNVLGMALASAGLLHPVVAALLMVGSSAIVSFRALRAASGAG